MPSDFLRDVLRTEDAARRGPRRWPLFPLSLAVHAAAGVAYFVIPLTAAVTLPPPAPLHPDRRWTMRVLPPEPVTIPATARTVVASRGDAPTTTPPLSTDRASPAFVPIPGLTPGAGGVGPVGGEMTLPEVPAGTGPPATGGSGVVVERKPQPALVKVGGDIRAPRRLAASAPVYPAIAQSARVEGLVILEAMIDVNGRVVDVRVLKSIPLLDAAAVDAVRTWRYTPTLLNGVPVTVLMTVTVNFTLER